MIASFVFLSNEENCPHKAYRKYVARDLPSEPNTPELEHGIAVHKALERRITEGTRLPEDIVGVDKITAGLDWLQRRGAVVKAELALAIDATGKPLDFWDKSGWLRGKLDAVAVGDRTAMIFDWKTGKPREDTFELRLQALLLKGKFPQLETIQGSYVWLRERRVGELHDLSDTERTMNSVRMQLAEIERRGNVWPKRPNPLCGWCPVHDCEHNPRGKNGG